MEMLKEELNRIWASLTAITLLLIMTEITLLAMMSKMEGKVSTILPTVNVYGKRVFKKVVKRITNLGLVNPITDSISSKLEQSFYMYIREQIEHGITPKFSENYLYPRWKSWGGTNKQQMRDMLDKAEAEGFLIRDNPYANNSTRVLAPLRYGDIRKKSIGKELISLPSSLVKDTENIQ